MAGSRSVKFLVPPPSDPSKARVGFLEEAAGEFKKLSAKERTDLSFRRDIYSKSKFLNIAIETL
jgi:hypothetical protein